MIAKAPFVDNSTEIEAAEKLGLDKIPEATFTTLQLGFSIDDVKLYHYAANNQIALYIGGFKEQNLWKVERDDAIIAALEAKFNDVN